MSFMYFSFHVLAFVCLDYSFNFLFRHFNDFIFTSDIEVSLHSFWRVMVSSLLVSLTWPCSFLGICGNICWFSSLSTFIFEVSLASCYVRSFSGYSEACAGLSQDALVWAVLEGEAGERGGALLLSAWWKVWWRELAWSEPPFLSAKDELTVTPPLPTQVHQAHQGSVWSLEWVRNTRYSEHLKSGTVNAQRPNYTLHPMV